MDKRLIEDINNNFNLNISPESISPVDGGWLNLKYRCESGGSYYLVKLFSHERYTDRQLRQIEQALEFQRALHMRGVLCPEILCGSDRKVMRFTDFGEVYSVSEFCGGSVVGCDGITSAQLTSLGAELRELKRELKRLTSEADGLFSVRGYPLKSEDIVDSLEKCFFELQKAAVSDGDGQMRQLCANFKAVLDSLDVSHIDRIERGLAHEDMSPDNMLFFDDRLSVILDFDRTQYSLVPHDIGRVLMSFCFDGERLDLDRVRAFEAGFGHFDITEALLCVWLIEAPWWLNVRAFSESKPKIVRFCRELIRLTEGFAVQRPTEFPL